jgi:hypothetical protein
MRSFVRASTDCTIYQPSGRLDSWREAEARIAPRPPLD